jgi:ribose/xylose/arabinose/galactoside ABC-type transport system permease subunit/ABC-type branched-subunit amino acid transport system ATPase component
MAASSTRKAAGSRQPDRSRLETKNRSVGQYLSKFLTPGSTLSMSTKHFGGPTNRSGLTFLLVAVVIFVEVHVGRFATLENGRTILANSASIIIASIAIGRLLISGNVDLSIGGMLSFIAVVVSIVARDSSSVIFSVIVALALGFGLGLLNGGLVLSLSISPIIVTLGLSFLYLGVAYGLTSSQSVFGFPQGLLDLGRADILGVSLPVWIALFAFLLGAFALTRTVGGIRSYAVGGNPLAAAYAGIHVRKHILGLYTYVGASIGLVALLQAGRLGSVTADLGTNFELEVLTAVILGGVAFNGGGGRPFGIFIGVALIAVLDAAMVFEGFQDYAQRIAKGVILLSALAADQYSAWHKRNRKNALPTESGCSVGKVVAANATATDPINERGGAKFGAPVLVANAINKRYGAVVALREVSTVIHGGSVTCLLGDNGAGKSTLIKIFSGALKPSSGVIELLGQSTRNLDAMEMRRRGVETVYQDLALCPNLGVVYNLMLGKEPVRLRLGPLRLIDRSAAEREATKRLTAIGVGINDFYRPVTEMSGGQRQSVAIARVVEEDVRLVILDEPTAALGVSQTENVLTLVRTLANRGAAVLLITHDVEIVKTVADHILVLRRGEVVYDGAAADIGTSTLLHLMAGISVEHAG